MREQSIGLLVLARNEAQSISRCLASVRDDVDQIAVADMASEDNTRQIAKDFGANVVSVIPRFRYDGCRQEALALLQTDWVLQLDADEWAPGVLPRLIEGGYLRSGRPIAFPKINYLAGRWIKSNRWWPNYQVRMFRRERGRYVDVWHNYLETDGKPVRLPKQAEFAIHHGGYESTAEMLMATARWMPDRVQLSARSTVTAFTKSLGGYLLTAGWREGSDGIAITAVRMLNELARQTSQSSGSE